MHQDIQEQVHDEIKATCSQRAPSLADIPRMILPLCVMYETIRLFPIFGDLPSRTSKEQVLLGRHIIPPNTAVGIDMVNLHRNERYWGKSCNEFDPTRFDNRHPNNGWYTTDEKIKIPVRGAFVAFGEGPRMCIGILPSFVFKTLLMAIRKTIRCG